MCEGVYLFLDDLSDIIYYIECCNKTHTYNLIFNGFVINDCLIQINTDNTEYSLLILPIKQKQK